MTGADFSQISESLRARASIGGHLWHKPPLEYCDLFAAAAPDSETSRSDTDRPWFSHTISRSTVPDHGNQICLHVSIFQCLFTHQRLHSSTDVCIRKHVFTYAHTSYYSIVQYINTSITSHIISQHNISQHIISYSWDDPATLRLQPKAWRDAFARCTAELGSKDVEVTSSCWLIEWLSIINH